jgi:hypothetical protein
LEAQSCGIDHATPVTCLTVEWVRTLAALQRTEDQTTREVPKITDGVEAGFYAIKTRLNAELFAIRELQPYRSSSDKKVAAAAAYPIKVIQRFASQDSAQQVALRRIVAFKSSVGEMQELSAERRVEQDQALTLLMAATGAVLDASVVVEAGADKVNKRRMTIRERDAIVAEIDAVFSEHSKVESDVLWYSAFAGVAASIRENLMGQWVYLK